MGISLKNISNDRLETAKAASVDDIDNISKKNTFLRTEEELEAIHGNRIMMYKWLPIVIIAAILIYTVLVLWYGDKKQLIDAIYTGIGYLAGLFSSKASAPKK